MNPNNVNKFDSSAVGITRKRSTFDRSSKVLTTLDSGFLVPIYWDEVLPGDNFRIKANGVCRMSTPIFPVLDNSYLDLYAFYVPNRLLWTHWENFMGENESLSNPWIDPVEYTVPQIKFNNYLRNAVRNKNVNGDILSYLGIPPSPNVETFETDVNALPVRAYCKIWNEWFRDENLQVPCNFSTGDGVTYYSAIVGSGSLLSSIQLSAITGGALLPVNKFKDYFTTALPAPQKGSAVTLSLADYVPVVTRSDLVDNSGVALRLSPISGSFPNSTDYSYLGYRQVDAYNNGYAEVLAGTDETNSAPAPYSKLYPSNLWADLQNATAITVNQLRMAFQTQKYLETIARSGSRYIETLYSLYGVRTSDARLQRSEYLGGKRIPIVMQQTVQTSATGTGETPQGNVSAFSLTGFSNNLCDKFFEEHGILMICASVRTDQTYGQGINKQWFRKTRFDYYAPVFSHIGEVPILEKEIYYGTPSDNSVLGYQEAWAEYRYKPNIATGYFSPNSDAPLTAWAYVNKFFNPPVLNGEFLRQSVNNVDNTLALGGELNPFSQFIVDLYIENKTTRVMPMYSVPGYIDSVG